MDLNRLVAQVKRLPASPQLLPRLMAQLKDPHTTPQEIVSLVKLDMALAAQVQRLSNSSYYGFSEASRDLLEAINRIGMQETFKLVATSLSQELASAKEGNASSAFGCVWKNSVACATVMEALAGHRKLDLMTHYTIGLMHNVGLVLMQQGMKAKVDEVAAIIRTENLSLQAAAQKVLAYDHAAVASKLLENWQFSSEVIVAIGGQYAPLEVEDYIDAACMIHIAVYLVKVMGYGLMGEVNPEQPLPEALERLELDEAKLQTIIDEAGAKLERLWKAFSGPLEVK